MKKYLIILALFNFTIVRLWSQEAFLNKYKGKIQIYDEKGKEIDVKNIKQIGEGYQIKTDKNSECEILFKDGTLLFVSENSSIKIEKGKYSNEERNFSFDFLKGKILFFVNKVKAKLNDVSIKTPTAVCAVRGTNFSIIASSETSNIGLFDGLLEVKKDEQIKELKPGNEAIVSREIKISERLSAVMEKEKARAEKLAKYVEKVRQKLEERQKKIEDRVNKNKSKIENFLNDKAKKQ